MYSTDLLLGAFLIICGFALSLLNLKRLIVRSSSFPAVLISENIILMCIGIAFLSRYVYRMEPFTATMQDIEIRTDWVKKEIECNFTMSLMSYGPIVVPMVNSFITLLIDNYMHYRMLADAKQEDDDNTVQDLRSLSAGGNIWSLFDFIKKYFSYLAIGLQWIVPILIALSMYPMEIKEKRFQFNEVLSSSDVCMALVDVTNDTSVNTSYNLEVRNFVLEAPERNYSHEVSLIINKVNRIVSKFESESNNFTNGIPWNQLKNSSQDDSSSQFWKKFENGTLIDQASALMWKKFKNGTLDYVASAPLWRTLKTEDGGMKICYLDNNSLLLYMFIVCIFSYFIPITISTVILTKIHVMNIKRPGVKTYVSRELLYNILFWTPVMFDTFLSLLLCSYSMTGVKTSIFNVIANVYQAVKNFMNTKYFKENSVSPM